MSKELTPLEALKEVREYLYGDVYASVEKRLDIIETALKDWELWKDNLKCGDFEDNRTKAIEIIKEKRVDIVTLLDCRNAKEYNRWIDTRSHYSYRPYEITQKEYDLLKEVLL